MDKEADCNNRFGCSKPACMSGPRGSSKKLPLNCILEGVGLISCQRRGNLLSELLEGTSLRGECKSKKRAFSESGFPHSPDQAHSFSGSVCVNGTIRVDHVQPWHGLAHPGPGIATAIAGDLLDSQTKWQEANLANFSSQRAPQLQAHHYPQKTNRHLFPIRERWCTLSLRKRIADTNRKSSPTRRCTQGRAGRASERSQLRRKHPKASERLQPPRGCSLRLWPEKKKQ